MDRHRGRPDETGHGPGGKCPLHRDGVRLVRIPIAPPPDDTPVGRGGTSPLIAAIVAVIRDALAADAAGGVVSTTSIEDDGD